MAGLPTRTDTAIDSSDALDENVISLSQGTTAQNWNGVYLEENATSVGNQSYAIPPGKPAPGFTSVEGNPGYPATGQPGGNPNDVLVPNTDGSGASGANILDVTYIGGFGSPPDSDYTDQQGGAGTIGGGTYYPNTEGEWYLNGEPQYPVPNPMIASSWTAQNMGGAAGEDYANEDSPEIQFKVEPEYRGVHGDDYSPLFNPDLAGGSGSYTVTTYEVNGVVGASLPTGFSLTTSTGALALSTSTAAGTTSLVFKVEDSSSPANWVTYAVTVILS